MVKKILLCFLLSYVNVYAAALLNLTKSIPNQTSFESVNNTWAASDDATINLQIGFSFPFNNTIYSNVWINSNGMLSFSSSNNAYSNRNIPYSTEAQSIFPYWDDLYRRGNSTITYGILGTGSNQRFIVSWNDVPHYPNNGRYKFQVILYVNGSIRFRYDDTSSTNGSSATIGVQENTSNYDKHIYNTTTGFDPSKDIFYSVLSANLSLLKTSCVISDLINGTVNPKRIPNSTIRYAIEVKNEGALAASNVLINDTVGENFDELTIINLQIKDGVCDCLGLTSTRSNGVNGTVNGVNPIVLDFGDVLGGSVATPTLECGYFEVKLK
jgi:uncharacterized repeat protein (TIGR01451 family)